MDEFMRYFHELSGSVLVGLLASTATIQLIRAIRKQNEHNRQRKDFEDKLLKKRLEFRQHLKENEWEIEKPKRDRYYLEE